MTLIIRVDNSLKKRKLESDQSDQSDYTVQSRKLEVTSRKLEVTSRKLEVTSRKLEITSRKLEVTSRKLEVTSPKLEITSRKLEVTSRKLEVTLEHLRADGVVGCCVGGERIDCDLLPHDRVEQRSVERPREFHTTLASHNTTQHNTIQVCCGEKRQVE
jgi:hypothetical protein